MMKRVAVLVACSIALFSYSLKAQDAVIDIPEKALNDLIAQLGSPSASGSYVSSATSQQVPWQWWVTDAHFSLAPGAMTFTATVLSAVGQENASKTMTVPASIVFDGASSSLRISISPFVVPIQSGDSTVTQTVTQVDVANIYGLSVPIVPQTFVLSLPGGGVRSVAGSVTGATMEVQSQQVVLNLTVGF